MPASKTAIENFKERMRWTSLPERWPQEKYPDRKENFRRWTAPLDPPVGTTPEAIDAMESVEGAE